MFVHVFVWRMCACTLEFSSHLGGGAFFASSACLDAIPLTSCLSWWRNQGRFIVIFLTLSSHCRQTIVVILSSFCRHFFVIPFPSCQRRPCVVVIKSCSCRHHHSIVIHWDSRGLTQHVYVEQGVSRWKCAQIHFVLDTCNSSLNENSVPWKQWRQPRLNRFLQRVILFCFMFASKICVVLCRSFS